MPNPTFEKNKEFIYLQNHLESLLKERKIGGKHYGLYRNEGEDPEQAEKNTADYFFRYLYKAPANVLVVGTDLDQLAQRLMDKGFTYTGISRDKALVKMSKKRFPDAVFRHTDLNGFESDTKYDIIIFRESTDQDSFASLFKKAGRLLSEEGRIFVMDTFSGSRQNPRNMKRFVDAAKKEGFVLSHMEDLTSQALPTIEHRKEFIRKYHDKIVKKLDLSPKELDEMAEKLEATGKRFRKGKISYLFMELEKVETKEQAAGEENGMLESLAGEIVPPVEEAAEKKREEPGRKKRALIFTSLPLTHVGGIEKVNLQIKNMLLDAGWDVDTKSYYDLDVEKLQKGLSEGNIMVYYDHFLLAGTYDWRSYDLVVTNDSVGGVCHSTKDTKVITLVHAVFAVGFNMLEQNLASDYNSKVRAFAEAASFRNKNQVISVSKKVQTELKEHFDAESIVINNGFDFDLFLPSGKKELNIRKEHAIPEDAIVGLYAGRWSTQEKRPDITLKLAKKFPDIYWVFATDKPIPGSDKMKNVIVIHNVPYEKMPSLYEEVDFTMQLSLYEGFSNFAIESIASKVPMISTRTGIIDEVYSGTDMESLLIEQSISRDVILKQAEEKVRELLGSHEFYRKASEDLYRSAKKRFSLERWREQMRKVLEI